MHKESLQVKKHVTQPNEGSGGERRLPGGSNTHAEVQRKERRSLPYEGSEGGM